MLIFFVPIIVALGVALSCRGQAARGLLVIAVALGAEVLVDAVTGRWPWAAFSAAFLLVSLVSVALARRED